MSVTVSNGGSYRFVIIIIIIIIIIIVWYSNTNNTLFSSLYPFFLAGTKATSLPTLPQCLLRHRSHLQLQGLTIIDQRPSPRATPLPPPHPVSRRAALVGSAPDGCCATTWEGDLPQPRPAPPLSTRLTASVPPRPQPTMVLSFQTPFPTSGPPPCQSRSSTAPQDLQTRLGVRVRGTNCFCIPLVPPFLPCLSLFEVKHPFPSFDLVPLFFFGSVSLFVDHFMQR